LPVQPAGRSLCWTTIFASAAAVGAPVDGALLAGGVPGADELGKPGELADGLTAELPWPEVVLVQAARTATSSTAAEPPRLRMLGD
jgi:hypothetical protein